MQYALNGLLLAFLAVAVARPMSWIPQKMLIMAVFFVLQGWLHIADDGRGIRIYGAAQLVLAGALAGSVIERLKAKRRARRATSASPLAGHVLKAPL